jgi:hypothetical protein
MTNEDWLQSLPPDERKRVEEAAWAFAFDVTMNQFFDELEHHVMYVGDGPSPLSRLLGLK